MGVLPTLLLIGQGGSSHGQGFSDCIPGSDAQIETLSSHLSSWFTLKNPRQKNTTLTSHVGHVPKGTYHRSPLPFPQHDWGFLPPISLSIGPKCFSR